MRYPAVYGPVICLTFGLIAISSSAQTSATVKLDKEVVDAGTAFTVDVTVDPAPNYDGYLDAFFNEVQTNFQIGNTVSLAAGKTTATIPIQVPIDAVGGTYRLALVRFGVANRKQLSYPPISVTVVPAQHLVSPSSAVASLSPNQRQFLQTKESELSGVVTSLTTRLSAGSADTPRVRLAVATALRDAEKKLLDTKEQYPSVMAGAKNSAPEFFDDFDAMYREALIELNAPVASIRITDDHAQLVRAQLKERPKSTDDRGRIDLVGSLPLFATAAIDIMSWNVAAYQIVETTGKASFEVDLDSVPEDAEISVRRITQTFTPISKHTASKDLSFPLAIWYFQFSKEGCPPQVLQANPYIERHPQLTAELNCQKR